jgi:hypothetical protein
LGVENHPIKGYQPLGVMKERTQIKNELEQLESKLNANLDAQLFFVPAGYFEALAETMLAKIKSTRQDITGVPVLDSVSKEMPYHIPHGYFERLEESVMDKVRSSADYLSVKEEIETLSPLLSGLKKDLPFSVPEDYFENLAPANNQERKPGKIVSVKSRNHSCVMQQQL